MVAGVAVALVAGVAAGDGGDGGADEWEVLLESVDDDDFESVLLVFEVDAREQFKFY